MEKTRGLNYESMQLSPREKHAQKSRDYLRIKEQLKDEGNLQLIGGIKWESTENGFEINIQVPENTDKEDTVSTIKTFLNAKDELIGSFRALSSLEQESLRPYDEARQIMKLTDLYKDREFMENAPSLLEQNPGLANDDSYRETVAKAALGQIKFEVIVNEFCRDLDSQAISQDERLEHLEDRIEIILAIHGHAVSQGDYKVEIGARILIQEFCSRINRVNQIDPLHEIYSEYLTV